MEVLNLSRGSTEAISDQLPEGLLNGLRRIVNVRPVLVIRYGSRTDQ